MRKFISCFCPCWLICCCLVVTDCWAEIDFARDIRPILSDVCYACHGPDGNQRVSALRLDTQDGLLSHVDGGRAVEPGDASASVLLQRITSQDADMIMPPPDAKRQLLPEQIALLKQWIDEGARWGRHWSLLQPQRPVLPDVSNPSWCENAIDRFVLARMESAGLGAAPRASRETLIRRLTLDLTGLPPDISAIESFVNDPSADAWRRVVDRLLHSPRYGERMAIDWLDAARYADTSGYQSDGPRDMWRWRDWVIDAFNADMPYDQFTIEQLAGDLLPEATLSQKVATGFNRNHRGNAEGGIVAEEYQVEYVVDRVDTTCTVWLGLTMGCARCHDHKYDPFTQRDFYQLFAYFNSIPENGRALKEGNSPPYIKAPTQEMLRELKSLDRIVTNAESRVDQFASELHRQQHNWEQARLANREKGVQPEEAADQNWTIRDGLLHRFQLDENLADAPAGSATPPPDSSNMNPRDEKRAVLSLIGSGAEELGDIARFGYFDRFSLAVWVKPSKGTGTIVSRMIPVEQGSGYYLHLEDGRLHVNLIKRWLDDSIRVHTRHSLQLDRWQHVAATYDGSRQAGGIAVYIDGQRADLRVEYDGINQSFAVDEPLRLGGGHSPFTGMVDQLQIYDRVLSPEEVSIIAEPLSVDATLAIDASRRSKAQVAKLSRFFLERRASSDIRGAHEDLRDARRDRARFWDAVPTVMVMREMDSPRTTHVLRRGQYDAPGERVFPGTPSALPPLPAGAPRNRLALASWLVAPNNPLTARVAVNRLWQMHFGAGLVRTGEDFGSQGELPSHPELLNFLATELVRSGWDIKALQRLIVSSATYQQSSRTSAKLLALDPENRLLSRFPRLRLPAETVRDQALYVSGLLSHQVGGPSVRPYQPDGLWKELASTTDYGQSHGSDLYRRSLYTYWKRTVSPPTMATLDAPAREFCVVRRSRTNTPLQALAMMNETSFVESARCFAERVMATEFSPEQRLAVAFRMATGRTPLDSERNVLLRALEKYEAEFASEVDLAEELIRVGESSASTPDNASELAAWTTICSLILNLDEVVNRE